jgi:hypothetical protein
MDDEAAKERAKQYVDGHDVELWHQKRLQNLKRFLLGTGDAGPKPASR